MSWLGRILLVAAPLGLFVLWDLLFRGGRSRPSFSS